MTGKFHTTPAISTGIVALAALAVPTWRFGSQFLLQFFFSPFQFFIIPVWLLAYFSNRTGVMPVRSGAPLRREEHPARFQRNVRFCILAGAVMFAFNLWISWQVVSRSGHH